MLILYAAVGFCLLLPAHALHGEADMGWQVNADDKDTANLLSSLNFFNVTEDPRLNNWWSSYKAFYYKKYPSKTAEQKAFNNFKANIEKVKDINLDMSLPFWATNNFFADLDDKQRAAAALSYLNWTDPAFSGRGLKAYPTDEWELKTRRQLLATVPDVDWRKSDKLTPIKNQEDCGACWAYAAVAAIESAYLIRYRQTATKSKLDLSEQHLIDCATWQKGYASSGCMGGCSDCAINFAHNVFLLTENRYPTKNYDQKCMAPSTPPAHQAVRLSSGTWTPDHSSEARLMLAVARQPIVFYFTVVDDFFNYKGGIYVGTSCGGPVNHGMVIVGYHKTSSKATSYWIIRNSWGAWWGTNGYAQIQMSGDKRGVCNMYTYSAAPPTVFSLHL